MTEMTATTGTTRQRRAGPATAAWGGVCAAGAVAYSAAVLWLTAQPTPGALLLAAAGSVLLAGGPVGLLRAGAAGSGRAARAGLAVAAGGWLVAAVANAVEAAVGVEAVALFVTSTVLVLLGMLVAGTAVLRARRWRGWRRGTPLLCALWLFPVAGLFGRDDLVGALALVSWLLTWAVLGAALLGAGRGAGWSR
jgi:uncharacterized membrane protein YhaH (DUF805 family)